MKKLTGPVRKAAVAIIGFPLIALGIILIPLPGPGLLVCAAGLFILSLEFDWADRYFKKVKDQLKKLIDQGRPKQR